MYSPPGRSDPPTFQSPGLPASRSTFEDRRGFPPLPGFAPPVRLIVFLLLYPLTSSFSRISTQHTVLFQALPPPQMTNLRTLSLAQL